MKTNIQIINEMLTEQMYKKFENNQYGARHVKTFANSPIAHIISGLAAYADQYHKDYPDSVLGDDYVLGASWIESLKGVRGLLNGELKGLDGGFTDSIILAIAFNCGFKEENF